jgi:CO/xanthine dehydrogenase FAD-binding subunit
MTEALDALSECPDFTVCAGGTALMPGLNRYPESVPTGWIFLGGIEELRGWRRTTSGGWRLGALVTLEELAGLGHDLSLVAHAARGAGSWQLRNAATLGGSLVAAWATSDVITALCCLDTQVEIVSHSGVRHRALEDFVLGSGLTALGPGELLSAVIVGPGAGRHSYTRVAARAANSPLLCALAVRADPQRETVRVAVADGKHLPRRAHAAEGLLLADADPAEFAAAAQGVAAPGDDALASAAYRRHAIGVLARRAHVAIRAGQP